MNSAQYSLQPLLLQLRRSLWLSMLAVFAIPTHAAVSPTVSSIRHSPESDQSLPFILQQPTQLTFKAPKLELIQNFKAHDLKGESLIRVQYSTDGQYFVTGASDGLAKLWTASGKLVREFRGEPKAMVFKAKFSADGSRIVTAGYDGTARVWSTDGEKVREFRGHQSAITDALISPDDRRIITSSDDGATKIWMLTGQEVATVTRPGVTRNLAISPKNDLVASTQDLGTVTLINLAGQIVGEIQTGQGRLNDVAFSRDGQKLVTAGFDGTARVWTITGKSIAVLKVLPNGWVTGADFSPDGHMIATVSDDGELRLWSALGQLLDRFTPQQGRLSSVSVRPDGKQLVATAYDGTVWLLSLKR
jgi:centriolar protein POC1